MTGQVDESPTVQGARWYCNGCPFVTPSKDAAVNHAIQMRDESPFNHMLYERMGDGDIAMRRVAVYASGLLQVEKRPLRKPKK